MNDFMPQAITECKKCGKMVCPYWLGRDILCEECQKPLAKVK